LIWEVVPLGGYRAIILTVGPGNFITDEKMPMLMFPPQKLRGMVDEIDLTTSC
jgi:hypothetical protein